MIVIFFMPAIILSANNPPLRNKVQVVVIDPGHGGKDPGAVGNIIKEKDVVLDIALKLGKYIEENFDDVKVIYTRKTDVFVELHERAQIANDAKADLFISIHANAVSKSRALGTETFVIGRSKDDENFELAKKENSVILLEDNYETKYQGFDPNSIDSYIIFSVMQKTYQGHSLAMAKMVQDEFEQRAKRVNRGVKQAGFVVLWRTTMPSILVETGFLTHPDEEKYLASEEGKDYLASAMLRAFRQYKNTIEENSNFETIAKTAENQGNAEAGLSAENLPGDILQVDAIPYFKVQVMVARNPLEDPANHFGNYSEVEEFHAGKWYKYAVGKAREYNEIVDFCDKVREEYPDAFVIAVKNGEIISLKEVLSEN
jgi:N-acetylmuramoyl-L-alanine amidase